MIADIQNLIDRRFRLRIILLSIKVLWLFPEADFEYVVVWLVLLDFSAYRLDNEAIQITFRQLGWFGMKMAVPPERVGEIAVRGTLRGKMMIIPGTLAKISSFFIRILPRRWVVSLYGTASD